MLIRLIYVIYVRSVAWRPVNITIPRLGESCPFHRNVLPHTLWLRVDRPVLLSMQTLPD